MICRVKKILRRLIFAFAALGAMGVTLAHAVPVYTITNLGQFTASALNDNNQVTGTRNNRAVIWDATNGLTDLGTLGGSYSFGSDINNMGQVIGSSETSTGERHAFVSNSTTNALTDLGTLGGTESDGAAINDNGQVTGSSTTSNGNLNVFIWDAANGLTDLGNLGHTSGVVQGTGINNNGQITGIAGSSGFFGDVTNGLAPLSLDRSHIVFPMALNNIGQVTGFRVDTGVSGVVGFVWDFVNGFTDFGIVDAIGQDINNNGQVVGRIDNETPLFWDSGVGYDLNNLIDASDPLFGLVTLTAATGINSFGNIVANGRLANGERRAFLLTAQHASAPQGIPEPSAFLLMLMGLILLGLVRCINTGKKCGDRGRALKYPVEMGYSILMNLINNNGE